MLYWWPLVRDLEGITIPKTTVVRLTDEEYSDIWEDNDEDSIGRYIASDSIVERVAHSINGFSLPVFIRDDFTSAKHLFDRTCYLTDLDYLQEHLSRLIRAKSFEEEIRKTRAFFVREFIPLRSPFKIFVGLPVSKERRYYAADGEVLCHHPYWTPDAVRESVEVMDTPLPIGWDNHLTIINHEIPKEIAHLTEKASLLSRCLRGTWALDFAYSDDDIWYFIDASPAGTVYHMEH